MKDISGFLLVNKPLNWTSFDVVAKIRKTFNIKRVGHTGTLDPLATGLMVIGIGQATRFLEFHVGHEKEYEAEVTFGAVSETYDAEGPLQITNSKYQITEEGIFKTIQENFLGEIEQVPPKYSALKINGEKYCNLVRQGKEVDIEAKKRKITLFENEILEYKWPALKLRIKCSTGTYIRSIAHDLGQILGCGAYLSELKRTMVEEFQLEDAKDLEKISEEDFLPLNSGLDFPILSLNESYTKRIQHGQRIPLKEIIEHHTEEQSPCSQIHTVLESIQANQEHPYVQIHSQGVFQGVAEIQKGCLKAKKMII